MQQVENLATIRFPPWAYAFTQPYRYKVAHGGRGSSKSWTFARLLIARGTHEKLFILCARELQISIKDSVYKLLCNQIELMGVSHLWDVGKSYIRCIETGTEFIFKGLRHNVNEIRSTEGIDIVWIEEAQLVSEQSWKDLIPTIRKDNSEIWVSFNPVDELDATYVRFIEENPHDALVVQVNYTENPWFPKTLEAERQYMLKNDPDSYGHVWLGECNKITKAQVLNGKWIVDIFEPQDFWDGPYWGADWGFSQDPTTLIKMWIRDNKLYIEKEFYGVGVEIDETPKAFDSIPGSRLYTITADSARPETISYMNRNGFMVKGAKKGAGSVVEGIKHLRSFEKIVIHPDCKHTAEEARLWKYKTDRITGEVLPILIDKSNHCWDAVRYGQEKIMKAKGEILIG